jgi:hypothetical protein
MGRPRRTAIAGAVLAAALLLAACGSRSGAGGATTLHDAMTAVRDGPMSRAFFSWADQHQLRALTGIGSYTGASGRKVDPKWARLTTIALPTVAGLEPQLTSATGIDVYTGSRAMTVGVAPEAAGRLDGANPVVVQSKLRTLGAQPQEARGVSLSVLAADDQVDVGNPHLGGDVYLALNRVAVKGTTVAFALASGPLDAVLGRGRPLADDADEAAVADCLGDVFVARVTVPPPGAAPGVTLVGVGVRRPAGSASGVGEVLCEVVNGSSLGNVAASMVQRTRPDATLPGSGLPVRDRVAQAVVDQVQKGDIHAARLTVQLVSPARAGFLLLDQGADGAGLAYLGGGTYLAGGSSPATGGSS